MGNLVRFDWAIKRLLRDKADYCVVEGLLSVVIGRKIIIKNLLESESNKQNSTDKFNRVDLLAEDESGALMIFEIQNSHEIDYFHRMAYGTSKALVEYLKEGLPYRDIRKVYSINIVYFSLGQGDDYAYHGKTDFVSMHNENDFLQLSAAQKKAFECQTPSDIFPEYYILRVDKFDSVAKTPLDEWISFLKSGEIPSNATAPGLQEAREKLRVSLLGEEELRDYKHMMDNARYESSVLDTGRQEGLAEGMEKGLAQGREEGLTEGLAKGREEGRTTALVQVARNMKAAGMSTENIVSATGLSVEQIESI